MFRFLRLALFACSSLSGAAAPDLRTQAERTDFRETGRYEEVERLSRAFADAFPKQVKVVAFGTTPEGRPMLALVASKDGVLDAASARTKQRPVVFFQGGIHAGEIDGKDAGFIALRHWLDGTVKDDVLSRVTVVFVPVFNIDGHERFGPNHRPNQRGPEAMGWRTTGQNLNLNRDYVKAEAPEMQALLRLLHEWDPIAYADLHVTDGAKFQHDIAVMVQPTLAGPAALRAAGVKLRDEILADLTAGGSLPLGFYPSFDAPELPSSGITAGIASPRFSDAYWGICHRIGILVETHSWKSYKERVHSTYLTLLSLVSHAAKDGVEWRAAARAAEGESLAGKKVVLAWQNDGHERVFEFKGYAHRRTPSEISGQMWTTFDETKPEIWRIPLRDQVKPKVEVEAPAGGYVVHAAHANWVAAKLEVHGIRFERVAAARKLEARELETFRVRDLKLAKETFEGRTGATALGEWRGESREIPAGSLFVPINQPLALVAMQLFEPLAPDSLLSWGFFNGVFEQKEYMEAYVNEEVARSMLAADPKLRAEFEGLLTSDEAFAASPLKRLEFFYRRSPSNDERHNLYPIFRVRAALPR